MYFLVVLVNFFFCAGLTLQLFFQRAKQQLPEPFGSPSSSHGSPATTQKQLRVERDMLQKKCRTEKEKRRHVQVQLRRFEEDRHKMLLRMEEDRRIREKLEAKLEEERLLRDNLQVRLTALKKQNERIEEERNSLKSMLANLCNNANAMEKMLTEMKNAQEEANRKVASLREESCDGESKESEERKVVEEEKKKRKKGKGPERIKAISVPYYVDKGRAGSPQPQDSPHNLSNLSTSSVCSVDSSRMTMKSFDSLSTFNLASSNVSVLTDDFHETRMRQSELYNNFELDSDQESL